MGDGEQLHALSGISIDGNPTKPKSILAVNGLGGNAQDQEILFSTQSMDAKGTIINPSTDRAVFAKTNDDSCVQLDRTPGGQLWLDLSEPMPKVGNNKPDLCDMSEAALKASYKTHAQQPVSTDSEGTDWYSIADGDASEVSESTEADDLQPV